MVFVKSKTGIVFIQLGSPKSPEIKDVRSFLRDFLGDPRVVDLNPFLWKLILNLFILPTRPGYSAKLYRRIWEGEEFPLIRHTREFTEGIRQYLDSDQFVVKYCFIVSDPKLTNVLDELETREDINEILYVSLFPQYSESTTESVKDTIKFTLEKRDQIVPYKILESFHKSKAFIDQSVKLIKTALEKLKDRNDRHLILSFHGIPKRRVLYKNDPYYQHCYETFFLLKSQLGLDPEKIHFTFQSRFGSEEWLTPYTEDYVKNLLEQGHKKLLIYAPSFVSDCLENLDELGFELNNMVQEAGGDLVLVNSLNSEPEWCREFGEYLVLPQEERNQLEYHIPKEEIMKAPEQTMKSPPLSDHAKSSIKIVFLTLFLDLVGFSIIFPLFPTLAKHYLEVDSDNYFLRLIFDSINMWLNAGGGTLSIGSIVLFGGALGALYSFLQFLAAPIWGGISDRIGRKPVLIISIAGLAFSYLLWVFSGSFTLLIFARFIGGIMGGNISTATAVVADVTKQENRSKGMAFCRDCLCLWFYYRSRNWWSFSAN